MNAKQPKLKIDIFFCCPQHSHINTFVESGNYRSAPKRMHNKQITIIVSNNVKPSEINAVYEEEKNERKKQNLNRMERTCFTYLTGTNRKHTHEVNSTLIFIALTYFACDFVHAMLSDMLTVMFGVHFSNSKIYIYSPRSFILSHSPISNLHLHLTRSHSACSLNHERVGFGRGKRQFRIPILIIIIFSFFILGQNVNRRRRRREKLQKKYVASCELKEHVTNA